MPRAAIPNTRLTRSRFCRNRRRLAHLTNLKRCNGPTKRLRITEALVSSVDVLVVGDGKRRNLPLAVARQLVREVVRHFELVRARHVFVDVDDHDVAVLAALDGRDDVGRGGALRVGVADPQLANIAAAAAAVHVLRPFEPDLLDHGELGGLEVASGAMLDAAEFALEGGRIGG